MQMPTVVSETVQCTAGTTSLNVGMHSSIGQEYLGEDDGTHNLTHNKAAAEHHDVEDPDPVGQCG